jgi:outer membrane receptor protein involved in Fe transport
MHFCIKSKSMKKISFLFAFISFVCLSAGYSQPPGGMNIGRIYGKVVDEAGKGVGYATVQVVGKKFDPQTRTTIDTLLSGQLTEDNGDFNIEKLPIVGEFTVIISFLGFAEIRKNVDFGIKMGNGARPSPPPQGATFYRDLGNIQFKQESALLDEVVVTGQASVATLSLDRKSFRVDKDLSAVGGTAVDALKNVPSLSVDLDGNVSLRNGAPQIFVDGKPTTLTLEQISADAIESVEVITNPSAKYDAGGGTAGIVNIVLKKDKRLGYNGSVRAGTDTRGGFNTGGDINARGQKINVFGSAMANMNRGRGEGETFRENRFGNVFTDLLQTNENLMKGLFMNARGGIDYLMDNRNTFTFSGSFVRGQFNPTNTLTNVTDFLIPINPYTTTQIRTADNQRVFRNFGLTGQFKHLFPKKGSEWTADINYNSVRFDGENYFNTSYDAGADLKERQLSNGGGSFFTIQTDFVTILDNNIKLEGGIRTIIRDNKNENQNAFFNSTIQNWVRIPQFSDQFRFDDDVYAAYLQAGKEFDNWGVQFGLRAESSKFTGTLLDRDSSYTISYPISLFPSLFITRKLNETDQIQMAYTRRVNRPNFFQTMPFTDFSDSLNLRRGNPALLPEFTNSIEISYQKIFSKGHNILASVYYKQASNLIAAYQFTEFDPNLNADVVIISFANSNTASALGGEFTLKNNLFKKLDITTNLNVFRAEVDASNVEKDLTINRWSAFLKETIQISLPKGFSFQLNGEYRTRASFTPSSGGDGWRGGMGGGQNTAQGYTKSLWFVDASIRKGIMKNQGNLTLSVQDIFASRRFGSFTESAFFTQDSWRIMNPQLVRVNFSYRFGKMDMTLFNRKNTRMNNEGGDMMGG